MAFNRYLQGNIVVAGILYLFVGWYGPANAAECPASAISTKSDVVQDARTALLALPIGDGGDTEVSADAQRAIAGMKAALIDFVTTYMSCAPNTRTPESIQNELGQLGHALQLEKRAYGEHELPPEAFHYGYELGFEAKGSSTNLMGIVARFGIACGSDAVLMLFQKKGNHGSWSWNGIAKPMTK